MKENTLFNQKIKLIIENLHPAPDEISFAIINLKTATPEISGFNMDKFMYPASIYKVFIGAEVLRQIYEKKHSLDEIIEIKSPNDVDKNYRLFPKLTSKDDRPLLVEGDKVTIDYLLDLVFSRSDNTASNVLIDLVTRESMNDNIIFPNNWQGSEITRKFLGRVKEDEKYRHLDITVTCARHLVELFYKIETNQLVNEWVSMKLKDYMHRWDRGGKGGLNLPEFKDYYRKGGWLEVNHYKINFIRAIKNVWQKGHAINRWSNDVGVVTTENYHYVIAVLTLTKTKWPWVNFPLKKFSREIFEVMN
ncbi:MAG: serine hydrolase [bacterium]